MKRNLKLQNENPNKKLNKKIDNLSNKGNDNQKIVEHKIDPNFLVDSNLFKTKLLSNKCKVNLRIILEKINENNKYIFPETLGSSINVQKLKIQKNNGQYINLIIPLDNYTNYFQPSVFLSNYFYSFKNEFPTNAKLFSYPNINISFDKTGLSNDHSNLDNIKKPYFKIICCIVFGFLFDIKLMNDCLCYPQTLSEFILFSSNISLNCLKRECLDKIMQNYDEIDQFNYSDCNKNSIQVINVQSKIWSSKLDYNINFNNFIENISKIN